MSTNSTTLEEIQNLKQQIDNTEEELNRTGISIDEMISQCRRDYGAEDENTFMACQLAGELIALKERYIEKLEEFIG